MKGTRTQMLVARWRAVTRRWALLPLALAPFGALWLAGVATTKTGPAVTCQGRPATIIGNNNPNQLVGTVHRDVIAGRGGSDVIHANAANDRVCGNRGRDHILGDNGDDIIEGGKQLDSLEGNGGRDRLYGDEGADDLDGGKRHDELFGNRGSDFLYGGRQRDRCTGGLPVGDTRQHGDQASPTCEVIVGAIPFRPG